MAGNGYFYHKSVARYIFNSLMVWDRCYTLRIFGIY